MRLIGHIKNEAGARLFGDYLVSLQIRNLVEPETDGSWAVWIHDEEQLDAGQQALARFQQNPADPKYQQAKELAAAVENRERQEQASFEERTRTGRMLWPRNTMGWASLLLIGLSAAVAVLAGLPPVGHFADHWWISEYDTAARLPEVCHGEIWRLVTPIFLHMSFIHILFNMMWLHTLGNMIEARMGSWKLLLMVLLVAVPSNLGQYLWHGPLFGGMSGVNYGLFGFVWVRGMCDPRSGLHIDQANTVMMIVWFFLCLFGVVPHVANAAHAIGFVIGILWGGWPAVVRLFRSNR